MKPRAEEQLEAMAVVIHGTLFSLHILGVIYNLRRQNKLDVLAHSLASIYDAHAIFHHLSKIKVLEDETRGS
jgi:hypothetical protein